MKEVNSRVRSEIEKQVSSVLKGRKVSEREIVNIESELNRIVNTDTNYSKQVGAIFAKGDKDAAINFIVNRGKPKMPEAIRNVLKGFGRIGTPPKVAAKPSTNGAAATIPGVPKTSDVDFTRTDMATYIGTKTSHGEAWLKNGKKAKW